MSTSALSSCGIGYLIQAGKGQSQLMRARQPIDRLIASDSTDATLKARLELVRAARDFASRELALPDNGSYRSYAALHRPYVVWNVVAAPEFSVQPKTWWFPITGRVAYRGYFKEENARQFALGLEAEGYDTLVGGVSAYSTLGRFSDPVLDTMMPYGDLQLVGTIFHELAHQLVYVKSDSEFNEAFAVSVEQAGLARWLEARGQAGQLGDYRTRQEQQAQIVSRFAAGRSAAGRVLPRQRVHAAGRTPETQAGNDGEDQRQRARTRRHARIAHRLRRLARCRAQQRTSRIGRDLLRLRAGIRAATGRTPW